MRMNKGLTQKELANKINYSVTYISDIETGRTVPAVKTLLSLAKVLEVNVSVLLSEPCCFLSIKSGQGCTYEDDYNRCKDCPLYKEKNEV